MSFPAGIRNTPAVFYIVSRPHIGRFCPKFRGCALAAALPRLVSMSVGRVVVVAHDELLVGQIAAALRAEAYTVHTADAWEDAARLVTAFAPQVLVAGLEGTPSVPHDLFTLRRSLGVRLVIVSAAPTAVEIDADAHLPCPVASADLLTTLQRLCGRPTLLLVNGIERRSATRPKRGDVRPCPRCGFAQRFEEPRAAAPAWMCRNGSCLDAEFVRAH